MSRYQTTGVPHTCPIIDAAIDEAEELATFAEPGYIITTNDAATIRDTIKNIKDRLEEVRGHNEELRDFGERTHAEYEAATARADELDGQLETAKENAEYYEERCNELESERQPA